MVIIIYSNEVWRSQWDTHTFETWLASFKEVSGASAPDIFAGLYLVWKGEIQTSTSSSICLDWHLLIFPLLALPELLAKAERLAKKFENMRAVRQTA
ncbi:hypothetical protein KSC_105870 [Ktedonobacter sp. SOSP1-52]|uniref:hypothetical protein n=1 Tax=Ktedonobacter sp. SOSP1-52 TaxID=2778366 RepID=UPI00191502AC|nr:hypothetical protein [Ktedonobacter sp. SOSP1-52]GHO71695.1 hypothetical protein KSC_105870 [Ktedonobacter sp. SOSP1-52]